MQGQSRFLLFSFFPRKCFKQHLSTNIEQKNQCYPWNELLEGVEFLDYRMDAEPSDQRHEELEEGVGSGNAAHPWDSHLLFVQTIGQGYGKGIHCQSDSQQYAVEEKQEVPIHIGGKGSNFEG